MTKTRPAPLGATYKRNVRPSWLSSRSDVASNGADRALFNPSYKDLAPTELGRRIANQTFVNPVSLADVASRVYHITFVNGAKSVLW
jgi:hypothetical protein